MSPWGPPRVVRRVVRCTKFIPFSPLLPGKPDRGGGRAWLQAREGRREQGRRNTGQGNRDTRAPSHARLQTCCVTLGKDPPLSGPQTLLCRRKGWIR